MGFPIDVTASSISHLDMTAERAAAEARLFLAEVAHFAPGLIDPGADTAAGAAYAEAIIIGAIERRAVMTAKVTTETQGRQSLMTRHATTVRWDPDRFTAEERDKLAGIVGAAVEAVVGPIGEFGPAWDYDSLFTRPGRKLP